MRSVALRRAFPVVPMMPARAMLGRRRLRRGRGTSVKRDLYHPSPRIRLDVSGRPGHKGRLLDG
eukprot:11638429-Heterocapsa_arctica.AAC.1